MFTYFIFSTLFLRVKKLYVKSKHLNDLTFIDVLNILNAGYDLVLNRSVEHIFLHINTALWFIDSFELLTFTERTF